MKRIFTLFVSLFFVSWIANGQAFQITNVAAPNGTYGAGQTITITVTFGTTVTATSATATLALNTTPARNASGSLNTTGVNTMTLTYTVSGNDVHNASELDYVAASSFTITGGTIVRDNGGGQSLTTTMPTPGAAGSLGGTSNILVDGVAPSAPATPIFASADDTGSSSSDGITNNTSALTFSGSAGSVENNSSVQLYDGSTPVGSPVTASGTGVWSIDLSLSAGSYSINAKATDAAGNTSAASGNFSLTIDTAPPGQPGVPDMTTGTDLGISPTDNITKDNTPDFTGSGTNGSTITVTSSVDGVVGTGTVSGGIYTITVSTLADGGHNITVIETDLAGNASVASNALAITIDTAPPSAPSTPDLQAGSDSGVSPSDDNTNDNTPTFDVTGTNGLLLEILDGATIVASLTATAGPDALTTSSLTDGVGKTITARTSDVAGNTASSSALLVTIGTTPPGQPGVPDMTATTDLGISSTDNITKDNTPDFTGSGTNGSTITVTSSVNGVVGTGTVSGGIYTITVSTLTDGGHNITVKETDLAGNVSVASNALAITIDTTPPSAPSTPDLTAGTDTGILSTDNITKNQTPSFAVGSVTSGNTIKITSSLNGVVGSGVAAGTSITVAVSTLNQADGLSHSIKATQTDPAGNTSTASSGLSITVDATPPTVTGASFFVDNSNAMWAHFFNCSGSTTNTSSSTEFFHLTMSETMGIADGTIMPVGASAGFIVDVDGPGATAPSTSTIDITCEGGGMQRGASVYHSSGTTIHLKSNGDNNWNGFTTYSFTPNNTIVIDVAGNELGTITNGTAADNQPPGLASGIVLNLNGSGPETLVFSVDEALNSAVTNKVVGFSVSEGTINTTPANYNSATQTITLTSTTDGMWDDLVTVTYTQQGSGGSAQRVRDPANNEMLAFTEGVFFKSLSLVSNNGTNTAYATTGDHIILNFTTLRPLASLPTVTIGTVAATSVINTSGNNYVAYLTTPASAPPTESTSVAFQIDAPETNITTTTTSTTSPVNTGSFVTVDRLAPTVTPITIASSNTNPVYAKVGDVVTVSYTATDNVGPITVSPATIDGIAATSITATAATLTTTASDNDGVMPFSITFKDVAGNTAVKTAITTGSSVTFDKTPPVATTIAISSTVKNNSGTPIGSTNGIVACPTCSNTSVSFLVTFSEVNTPLTGIDPSDFVVSTAGGSVTFSSPLAVTVTSATTRTVTINGISGYGKISLGLTDNNTIIDAAGNPLAGAADGSIATSFTGSQYYTIAMPEPGNQSFTLTSSASDITQTSITIHWSSPIADTPLPTHYLVMATPTSVNSFPSVNDGIFVSNATFVQNVTRSGVSLSATFNGLATGTSYNFTAYKYTLAPNNTDDNVDFELTSQATLNNVVTNTATASWAVQNSTAVPISSITDNIIGGKADVLNFTIYDDGQNPISPNIMTLNDNGASPETITFNLQGSLVNTTTGSPLSAGSSLNGFSSSSGTVASAIYNGGISVTLTNAADNTWDQNTTISYSPTTGNVKFSSLGIMEPIVAHAVTPAVGSVLTFSSSGTYKVPVGVTGIKVETWGAGGSGAGSYTIAPGVWKLQLSDPCLGWQGGLVNVYVNGSLVVLAGTVPDPGGCTLATVNYTFSAPIGATVFIDYTAGSFASENTMSLFDASGTSLRNWNGASAPNDFTVTASVGGSGAGGGAYSLSNLTVTPGASHTVVVGAGGIGVLGNVNGNAGGQSSFGGTLVVAKGGAGGSSSNFLTAAAGGIGGQKAAGTGDVVYSGGNGGMGTTGGSGGGGGSSAGTTIDGNPGGDAQLGGDDSYSYGTYGSVAGGAQGGYGWNYQYNSLSGYNVYLNGYAPGGGGGGVGGSFTSGSGGNGQVKITVTSVAPPSSNTWASDNSPFKFNKVVFTPGTGNSTAAFGNDWTNIIAGAELNDGTGHSVTINSSTGVNAANLTFSGIPASSSSDVGYITDANGGLSSKTYTLKIWLRNDLSNSLAQTVDGLNLAFAFDPSTNLTYEDVTNSNEKSSRLNTPLPAMSSGACQIQVAASQLVYHQPGSSSPTNTNPQATIGVGTPFSSSSAQNPEVYALDANNNLDLDYSSANGNNGTISNPLQGFAQSTTSLPFTNGKLTLKTLDFTTGSLTLLNTKIVVTGTGTPAVSVATSTNVWPVISSLGMISTPVGNPSKISSLTTALTGATAPQKNAVRNFDFTITDDFGADATTFTDNDKLPTILNKVKITQGAGNSPTLGTWTDAIEGAVLLDSLGSGLSVSGTVNATSLVFDLSPAALTSMATVGDNLSKTYRLKIWLKNPVNSSIADVIDDKNFEFSVDNTPASGITLTPALNVSSTLQASSATSGAGKNKVDVAATQLDFTTQWLLNANQNYDAPLSPSPIAKPRDANGNVDIDWSTAASVTTAAPATYPPANTTVTNNFVGGTRYYTFDPTLQVTSAGNGADGASTNLVLSSAGIPTAGNGISNSFVLNYSHNSDIVQDNVTPFVYSTNILYASANNQAGSPTIPLTAANGIALEQFLVRDGGASHIDTDGSPTVLTSITLDVDNYLNLRELALFNGSTNIKEISVIPGNYTVVAGKARITFNGFIFTVAKNTNAALTIKGSFIGNGVMDNQVISFKVVSVGASPTGSSQFANTSPTGIQSTVTGNQNRIEVVATQIVYSTIPASASLNVPFQVVVQAQDGNLNLDLDYNGTITSFDTNPTSPTFITASNPSGIFASGSFSFPYTAGPPATGFQFTTGNGNTQLVLNSGGANSGGSSDDAGSISGTSATISVLTSFDSWMYFDPTFAYTTEIDFVPFQNPSTSNLSQALGRVILSDGGAPGSTTTTTNPSPGTKNLPFGSHDDVDGAFTEISDFTISLTNYQDIKKIGLYTVGGTQIGADQTPSSATVTFNSLNNASYRAADNDAITFVIRAVFNSTITDQDQITMKITAVTHSAGSQFPANTTIAGIAGGDVSPSTQNFLDVIATSLDFTTLPSPFAGINEPIGPTTIPVTSAGIVTARDKFANIDTGFAPATITLQDASNNVLIQPAGLGFVSGVMNLTGMQYPVAVGSNGAVKTITTGPSLNSSISSSGNSILSSPVNVLDITVTYDNSNGVVPPTTASPPGASLKGGNTGYNIFGLKFTANSISGSEPYLKGFTISFDVPFETPSATIFKNFIIKEVNSAGTFDITSATIGGTFTKGSSQALVGTYDQIIVTLNQPLGSEPTKAISFFLFADVDSKVNLSTPVITPFFSDLGYGSPDDQNSKVSNGTSTGSFMGNKYSFASTQPPILLTTSSDLTSPYSGQPNVDPFLQTITLQFNTDVGSFDRGGPGNAELWIRKKDGTSKVADLVYSASQSLATVNPNNTVNFTYPTISYDITDPVTHLPLAQQLDADSVYFVKLIKGNYDASVVPGKGQGITDFGLNFFGGISSSSTLYFKISSSNAPVLSNAKSSFNTTSIGTVTTSFDQFGTAFFLIVKQGDPAPTKTQMLDLSLPTAYSLANPTATVGASGNYQITSINANQTHVFTATNFVAGQAYDVYIIAENDAVSHGIPSPVVAAGVYGSSPYLPNTAGPTTTISAGSIPSSVSTTTPNLSNSNFLICPDSYSTITSPIIIAETATVSFHASYVQDFNILLPTGYQFDVTVAPNVQLFSGGILGGGDFSPLFSGGPISGYKYTSNTVLNISFNNSATAHPDDYIVITGLSIIGKTGSSQGNINWFYGNNVFTNTPSYAPPTFSLGTIAIQAVSPLDFYNSYWQGNKSLFNAIAPIGTTAGDALNKTVNTIPDNFQDKVFPGQLQLIPDSRTVSAGDYLASFFSGNGVSGDLFTLNSVATGAAFNITITHTDLNGCITQKPEQYLVYDHRNTISNKLGLAYPAPSSLAGTEQAIVNTNWPAVANPISSQILGPKELAGYTLQQLTVDLPSAEVDLNQAVPLSASQFISGASWRTLIQNSVLNNSLAPSYTWDYSSILNTSSSIVNSTPYKNINTPPGLGLNDVYDYFKSTTVTPLLKNNYWQGGFLGNIEFTGIYQSTADNSVYSPFRQNVGLYIPAVPALEVTSAISKSDLSDITTGVNGVTVQSLGATNKIYSSYPGTAVFCEHGGIINISGYPLATSGVSSGVFGIYDYASYDFTKVFVPSGIITTLQGSLTVTGVNTLFSTELKVGATLFDPQGNIIGQVASIAGNTQLTLVAVSPTSISSSTFRTNLNKPITYANTAFVDNANGSMTLDPLVINNLYNDILITYTYQESASPAFGIGYLVIRVTPNPVPQFTLSSTVSNPGASDVDKFCKNSLVTFDASVSTIAASSQGTTTNTIDQFVWDFGDVNSTQNNASGVTAAHPYTISSVYTINLSLVSNWSCPSLPAIVLPTPTKPVLYPGSGGNITVGDIPIPVFTIAKNCVGDLITFDASSSSVPGNSTLSTYTWDYNSQIPTANGLPNPSPSTDSKTSAIGAGTTYSKSGFYNVVLTTITTLGCQRSLTHTISQLDTISAFNNNFDSDNGGWQAVDLSSNLPSSDPASKTSWSWGVTSGKTNPAFNSASNNKLWSTSGTFYPNEKSSLYSACLIINVPRPMISFSSYVDVNTGDGLVLQYSTDALNIMDANKTWTNLGTTPTAAKARPGIDWFNAVALPSTPGSSNSNSTQTGWSGHGAKWTHPKHSLDTIAGQQRVILRFAYSSLSGTNNTDGVAIDSVFFGSRTRTILFENFTTTDDGGTASISDLKSDADFIAGFVQQNISGTQLVNINYHIGFIGTDPFNMDNPADPSSRALYYNVNKVPYAFLDGVHYQDNSKTPPSDLFGDWGQGEYDLNTLQLAKADFLDPSSNTKLTTVTSNPDGSLQVDVNFTPVFDLPFGVRGGTVLQVAILEKQISTIPANGKVTTGETSFGYVLKKMLPNAAGTKFTNPITAGVPVSAGSFTWTPTNLHSDKLTVVVFLQNENTKEVYQAFIQDDVPVPPSVTAIEPITADNIKVYPNPADQEFTIELPSPVQQSMKVTMANQLGQFTEMGAISEGELSKKISTQGLAEGVYILQLGSNGNALRTKVVVLHK